MVDRPEDRRRQQLEAIGDDFKARGYSVKIEPSPLDVPISLRVTRPDIVAEGFGEHLAIEVRAQAEPGGDRLKRLAEAVGSVPGWRLVVVAPPPEEQLMPGHRLESASPSELRRWLEEAEALNEAGAHSAAFLLGWSALEGMFRYLAEAEGLPVRQPDTASLVRLMGSIGIIEGDDFQTLQDLYRRRSIVAHGFRSGKSELPFASLYRLADRLLKLYERPESGSNA